MGHDWDLRAAWFVRERIVESGADIVHAHDARSHAIARVSLIGMKSPPLVVTRRVPFVPKAARLKYGNRVTRFIAVSVAVHDAMVEEELTRDEFWWSTPESRPRPRVSLRVTGARNWAGLQRL